jgi:xylulokinase
VAAFTGSAATERFAGPQIRKFWKNYSEDYEKTTHITLISAFITALLIGRTVPVDAGDGFGMNLADPGGHGSNGPGT